MIRPGNLATATSAVILSLVFAVGLANAQTFSGQATAVKATVITGIVPGVTTAVSDTGPLPSAGGSINLASASANVSGILGAGASTVNSSGSVNSSQSAASIAALDVNIAGFVTDFRVRADTVASTTMCTCPTGACAGGSTITNLRIGQRGGGTVIAVTGAVNQTEVVVIGPVTLTVVINEHIVSPSSITVNALHITLNDSLTGVTTDVVVSSSHSDIKCTINPPVDRYSGRATGVDLSVSTLIPLSHVSTIVSDTGFLPTSGGNIAVSTTSVNVAGVLSTGVVTSNTSGGLPGGNEDTSQSDSTVNNLSASLIGAVTINATLIQSNTMCQCGLGTVSCTGGSTLTNLAVVAAGIPVVINITGAPNQIVNLPLGLGSIIINEQISAGSGDITVNALHVLLTPLGLASTDLIVAHSHSDIQCALSPTAAGASVSGRVLDQNGSPVSRARIVMMDQDGMLWSAMTGPFGEYRIDEIPAGNTYFMNVSHKRYSFGSRVINVEDNIAGLDFTAE
jgi:hypothetical protein